MLDNGARIIAYYTVFIIFCTILNEGTMKGKLPMYVGGVIVLWALLLNASPEAMAATQSMKFTTQRNNAATKDWTTDQCTGTYNSNKTLTITGMFPTGRTDLPFQNMVIEIKNFKGNTDYSLGLDKSYFEDIFQNKIVHTDFVSGYVNVTDYDKATSLLHGTFNFFLYSVPPATDKFTTRIYNGEFYAKIDNALTLQVSPTKDPFPANAGTTVNFKSYVKDIFGNEVEDVELYVDDEINKLSNQKIGTTNSKGEFVYQLVIPADTKTKQYELNFTAIKLPYRAPEPVKKKIDVSGRYWIYTCGGVPLLTFDAGEGEEFKKPDNSSPIIEHKGRTLLNDILYLEGTVRIDPTKGQEQLDGDFKTYIKDMMIAGERIQWDLTSTLRTALTCDTKLKLAIPEIAKKEIGGKTISIEEFSFVDLNYAVAVKIKGQIKWENVAKDACGKNSNTPEVSALSIALTVAKEELGGYRVEQGEIAIQNFVLKPFPQFCIDNLSVNYDGVKDAWTIAGACELKVGSSGSGDAAKKGWEGKMKASLTIEKGSFEAFSFEGKTTPGVPIPDLPIFEWSGLKLSTSGWSKPNWNSLTVGIGGFFISADEMFKTKFPVFNFLGKDPVTEIEINGKYAYPFTFEGEIKGKMFAFKPVSVTRKWQIEFSGGAKFDLYKGMESKSKTFKAIHFGGDDFVFTAEEGGTQSLLWADDFSISSFMQAKLRIPDMPADVPDGFIQTCIKFLKASSLLPHDLGKAGVYYRSNKNDGVVFSCAVDVSQNPVPFIRALGKLSLEVGIKDKLYVKATGMNQQVTTKAYAGKSNQVQGMRPNNRYIQAVPLDTFTVTSDMSRVFVMINSAAKAPTSVLIDPDGTTVSATKSDSSIIKFATPDNSSIMWTIVKPTVGLWQIALTNPSPSDSVLITALIDKEKTFSISATTNARTLNISWDGQGYANSDKIDFFLTRSATDFGGVPIGSASAGAGTFAYTMNDTLPECSYHLYGIRMAEGMAPTTAYAAGEFSTGKSILQAPANITVASNQYGIANVSWVPVSDPKVTRLALYVKTATGGDSLLTEAYPNEANVSIECDTALLRSLYVVAISADGLRGCPRNPQSIIVDVPEERGLQLSIDNPLRVVPNPANAQAGIRFMLPNATAVRLCISNALGQIISDIPTGMLGEGEHTLSYNTLELPQGMYIVRILTPDAQYATTMAISR